MRPRKALRQFRPTSIDATASLQSLRVRAGITATRLLEKICIAASIAASSVSSYIEPKNDSGQYDREVFLAMHQWEPYYSASMEESDEGSAPPPPNNGLEVGYRAFSFNDKALGHGEPIRVKRGDRVLFHFLNASATETVNVGIALTSIPGCCPGWQSRTESSNR